MSILQYFTSKTVSDKNNVVPRVETSAGVSSTEYTNIIEVRQMYKEDAKIKIAR